LAFALKSPVTVSPLLTVVVPELAPMFNAVAAPAKLMVVAVALKRFAVVWVVVIEPPLTATLPAVVTLPVKVEVPSTVKLPFAWILPLVSSVVPEPPRV